MNPGQARRVSEDFEQERPKLRNFIRKRIANDADLEDILQDVFFELVEAYRLMQPVEHVGAWLFRVARNRIADFFRRKRVESIVESYDRVPNESDMLRLDEMLPSENGGTEAAYMRSVLIEAFIEALADLPDPQRQVFIAHELEGRSFKQLAAETGESVNTLLSRKHYAVRTLRERLSDVYDQLDEL